MGCDGGTIPKRKEIVKNKQKDRGRDKNSDLSAKWQFCAISGLRLKKPIVSCKLGRLYNKVAIIEYLLSSKTDYASSSQSAISHVRSLKDVKELKLKEKPDFDKAHQAFSGSELFKAQFVCPVSGLDVNGKYKFYFLWSCGCVFSERALKEIPSEKRCILCSKPYSTEFDLIVLNGDELETKELGERITARRRQLKSGGELSSTSEERSTDQVSSSSKPEHQDHSNKSNPKKRQKTDAMR